MGQKAAKRARVPRREFGAPIGEPVRPVNSPPAARPAPRRRRAALVLALGLALVLPVLAFQGVSVSEAWERILGCEVSDLAWGGLLFLAVLLIRAWRWRWLLSAQRKVRLRSCLSATCVGFLGNNVLPFRLGDLVRVGAIGQLERVNAARALGTVAVERVLEVLALVFLLGGYLTLASGGPHQARLVFIGLLALGGGLSIGLGLAVGYWRRAWLERKVAAVLGWFSPALGVRVAGLLGCFLEGLQVFTSAGQALGALGLSLGLWGVAAGYYYFVGRSLGLDLPPVAYTVVVFTTAFGALIPAAPGAVGTFHSFAGMGLLLIGVASREKALAFAALLHALEWSLINVTGVYFLWRDGLRLAAAPEGPSDATPSAAGGEPRPAHHPQPV